MKKVFALLNALLILSVLIGDIHYIEHGTVRIKAITSSLFVMIGAVNLVYAFLVHSRKGYCAMMVAGLLFAMMGDVGLCYNFVHGAALFAIGHILFFASYCMLKRMGWIDLICIAIVLAGAFVLLFGYKRFRFGNTTMRNVCFVYALIISAMTGKAISNFFRERNLVFAVAAIGSVMFFVSDLMLALYMFARMPRVFDTLCLSLYYPGECLLGLSSFLYVNRAVKQ